MIDRSDTMPGGASGNTAGAPGTSANATLELLRAICHLAALVAITWWALTEWTIPWPGILAGAGFFVLTVLIWALFLSPRAVLHVDRFGRGLIELLLIAGAVAAMLGLGAPWYLAAAFGVLAAALGYASSARSEPTSQSPAPQE